MKKIISLLLAVMMLASVAAVSFSAAGTAKVTVVSLDGIKQTKTFNVGDTFTVYTTLDASAYDGKIAAIKGEQTYNSEVVALDAQLESDGQISDNDAFFPVTKDKSIGNGGTVKNMIHFSASNPSMTKPFIFGSEDNLLIVSTYTVVAEGETEIATTITTLATSDEYLTKIINKGEFTDPEKIVVLHSSFTYPDEPVEGAEVKGKVTSFLNEEDEVTLALYNGDEPVYTTTAVGNDAEYAFEAVEPGTYTLEVSKNNHVTRTYELAVSGDIEQDVKICPIGDANNDGEITQADSLAAIRHVRLIKDITDEYQFKCADINGDGEITQTDALGILRHVRLVKTLF